MKTKEYYDYEYREQVQLCKKVLGTIGESTGGEIFERFGDDPEEPVENIFLAFTHEERPFRVYIYLSWGDPELHARIDNRTGVLSIKYDPEVKPVEEKEIEVWDVIDRREKRLFLKPGLYIEEYDDELEDMVSTIRSLPESFIDEVEGMMKKYEASSILYDSMVIDLEFERDIVEADYTDIVPECVTILDAHARILESGNREVHAKPKVYIQGKPALKAGVEGTVRCRYCSALVIAGISGKCSQCGATL